jgi:hypothetical protein
MLIEESSEASMLPISTPEVFRFPVSLTADNLLPFPSCSVVHLRFLSSVSHFGLRLSVPPSSATNLALIHNQFDIKDCVVSLQININLNYF